MKTQSIRRLSFSHLLSKCEFTSLLTKDRETIIGPTSHKAITPSPSTHSRIYTHCHAYIESRERWKSQDSGRLPEHPEFFHFFELRRWLSRRWSDARSFTGTCRLTVSPPRLAASDDPNLSPVVILSQPLALAAGHHRRPPNPHLYSLSLSLSPSR